MKRGNSLIANISKLNTFVNMTKSNEHLGVYIEKILNNRSKNLKFISDFDYIALDLLYTSLQIMNYKERLTKEEFNKIDKKELKYYMDKIKGINYFKNQIPSIKNEEVLIDYLKTALANGEYVCNYNNTIKFDNGLVIDSDWLVEFASFLITSLNNNVNLKEDKMSYCFYTITIPSIKDCSFNNFVKDIKLYEYQINRKDEKCLSYQDVKYLIDILSPIEDYDFKKLQDINSTLSKEKFSLSINKSSVTLTKEEKSNLEKLMNEDNCDCIISEYLKNLFKCYNSEANKNKRRLIRTYELIRGLVHAYKNNYPLEKCRKAFAIKSKEEILNAFAIANFYINYIYDESNLHNFFNYSLLDLSKLNPTIIDYETPEYKSIISELSKLNKKVVTINRRINKCLHNARHIPKSNLKLLEENSKGLTRDCAELESLVKEIRYLREQLNEAKDENRYDSNINKTKIQYIKNAIISGGFYYDPDTTYMIFDCYSNKDYHHTFHLELSLNNFISILLSDSNRNIRINFYQI